ncbi:hypothetical protein LOAG_13330 [Loa loa]|uniref:Uncharacterized protein n=1 Tax=Loa loa TaxID=7209 RepID=A0A1S0TKP2_LOALO|nr:hypothetical protein LOAG_13330 [Loa loa]EFO15182.1 hypothetical protein LOAG_13330 [Loa loa]
MKRKEKKTANCAIICPYSEDNSHVIPVCDMLLHLAKCRRLYYKRNGIKTELKRCKYNGCHYILAPEMMLHELTCHSRMLYEECKRKMKYPPVSFQITTSSTNLNELLQGMDSESVDHPDLMTFD